MFYQCTSLTTAPALPATTLADNCYYLMFNRCSSLTIAPNLPATALANSCYRAMFQYCTSLTTAPALPATTLASNCYNAMFQSCTSLTIAPALPATALTSNCYYSMFYQCTSLTTAPALPATTLAVSCYYSMFYQCTSLTTAPNLPATTLANTCYCGMFQCCTSLTIAPNLPATTLAYNCYCSMFQHCTSLTTAPNLPATTLADSCYYGMFRNCASLEICPKMAPATTLAEECYELMFAESTNVKDINGFEIIATDFPTSCFENMFSTTSLTKAAKMPKEVNMGVCCCRRMYDGTQISEVPDFTPLTISDRSCAYMFRACPNIILIDLDLSVATLNTGCYYQMFKDCTHLENLPKMPREVKYFDTCCSDMFNGCSALDISDVAPDRDYEVFHMPKNLSTETLTDPATNMFANTGLGTITTPSFDTDYYYKKKTLFTEGIMLGV